MKKVKRFKEGGDYESSDDTKNLISAAEREAVEFEGEKIAKPLREAAQAAKAEPMKMASFSEAFKEARGRGDKTFEYMGKKYTTETAKSKKESKPSAGPRMTDTGDEMNRLSRRSPSPVPRTDLMRTSPGNVRLGAASFKKGGTIKSASARADGCAQRGKTRGKMM